MCKQFPSNCFLMYTRPVLSECHSLEQKTIQFMRFLLSFLFSSLMTANPLLQMIMTHTSHLTPPAVTVTVMDRGVNFTTDSFLIMPCCQCFSHSSSRYVLYVYTIVRASQWRMHISVFIHNCNLSCRFKNYTLSDSQI